MSLREEVRILFKEKQNLVRAACLFEELTGLSGDGEADVDGAKPSRGAHVMRRRAKKGKRRLGIDEMTYIAKTRNGWSFRYMAEIYNVTLLTVYRRHCRGAVKLYEKYPDCFDKAPVLPAWMKKKYSHDDPENKKKSLKP